MCRPLRSHVSIAACTDPSAPAGNKSSKWTVWPRLFPCYRHYLWSEVPLPYLDFEFQLGVNGVHHFCPLHLPRSFVAQPHQLGRRHQTDLMRSATAISASVPLYNATQDNPVPDRGGNMTCCRSPAQSLEHHPVTPR